MGTQGKQLEREAQQARVQLSGPLEELRARMAPAATDRQRPGEERRALLPRVDKEVSQQNPWQDARVMEQAHEPH
jgi:hypothetical protein